jgi:hypothetical protein
VACTVRIADVGRVHVGLGDEGVVGCRAGREEFGEGVEEGGRRLQLWGLGWEGDSAVACQLGDLDV